MLRSRGFVLGIFGFRVDKRIKLRCRHWYFCLSLSLSHARARTHTHTPPFGLCNTGYSSFYIPFLFLPGRVGASFFGSFWYSRCWLCMCERDSLWKIHWLAWLVWWCDRVQCSRPATQNENAPKFGSRRSPLRENQLLSTVQAGSGSSRCSDWTERTLSRSKCCCLSSNWNSRLGVLKTSR